jgi:hypothetical protein
MTPQLAGLTDFDSDTPTSVAPVSVKDATVGPCGTHGSLADVAVVADGPGSANHRSAWRERQALRLATIGRGPVS